MEEDRAKADLGVAINDEFDAEKQEKPKKPKKRFVGRRTAAEHTERTGPSNETIEDSGAVQGRLRHALNEDCLAETIWQWYSPNGLHGS